ncbi:MAG: CvpA family protein [Butyricicoccus sp.]|nr:CvpA family protein [Butyricicoccus sp.]
MDTQTLIETCKGLLNLPDLILLALILASACVGASRGLVRTACNALGRLIAMVGASAAAKMLAPVLARFLVTPIVGDVFEVRAADLLSRMPEAVTEGVQAEATRMAAEMAESLAFFLLFFILMFAANMLVHMISTALRLVTRLGPIGFLDSLAGFVLGAVLGLVLCFLGLWALELFAPGTFGELGYLSPDTVAGTTLTAFLLGLIPSL